MGILIVFLRRVLWKESTVFSAKEPDYVIDN
jgi:hypothetical protein